MKSVHLLYSLMPGGAENVALNYCKVLSQFGIESVIVGPKGDESYERLLGESAHVSYTIDKSMLQKDTVIFVHCNQWLPRLLKYLHILKKNNIRVFYIQHLYYSSHKFRFLSVLINLICTDFIQITPITTKLVKRYIHIRKHFIVNFYISHYEHENWKNLRTKIREELGIPEYKIIVCFSAILKPGKRVGDFLDLAKNCRDKKDFHFLLIGDGPEREFVTKYHFANLTWVGKVNDVEKYLIASDIYFFPSQNEMMPMALIEAINTDKRIIAYTTEINNFLLDNKTFHQITETSILKMDLPDGAILKHYDFEYGIEKIGNLLRQNNPNFGKPQASVQK